MAQYSYLFKYIIIGDSAVGKSCFMIQFTDKRFKSEHDLTIGVEFSAKNVQINGQSIKIQMWDTAGQESFRSITRSYYRGAAVALLLFDVTNRESFDNLAKWVKEARAHVNKDVVLMLVGNKIDLASKRVVTTEEAEAFANSHSMLFLEASAKEDLNVDPAFVEPARKILTKIENGEYNLKSEGCGIKIGQAVKSASFSREVEEPPKNGCKC